MDLDGTAPAISGAACLATIVCLIAFIAAFARRRCFERTPHTAVAMPTAFRAAMRALSKSFISARICASVSSTSWRMEVPDRTRGRFEASRL